MSRPEHQAPPEIFYSSTEADKYSNNTRIMTIQSEMSERALELLQLPEDSPSYILDIGCGSGLSGESIEEQGHVWVGIDIAPAMLQVAHEREIEGDLLLGDMGEGMPFRAGSFDGAISISALQWLCNVDKSYHKPGKRLSKFFTTLYACLSRGSRAVFQFYPESSDQVELITSQAMRSGFTGGVLIDYPNSSKAKKFFLVLMTGGGQSMPKPLGVGEAIQQTTAHFETKRDRMKKIKNLKAPKKSKAWIKEKKKRAREFGKDVTHDSKYTGRKRKVTW